MKTIRIHPAALALLACLSTATIRADEAGPDFFHDFDKAVAASEESGKPTIVIFSASWCPPCQQMKKAVYPSEIVQPYHERLVWTYLDADDPKNGPVAAQFGVSEIPHIAFLKSDGDPIGYFNGAIPPKDFVGVLDKVIDVANESEPEESTEGSAVTP